MASAARAGCRRGCRDLTQIVLQAVSTSIGRLDYDFRKRNVSRLAFRGGPQSTSASGDVASGSRKELATTKPATLAAQPLPMYADWWRRNTNASVFLSRPSACAAGKRRFLRHAFWQTAVEGRAASEVAEELKLKLGALYTANSRVLALIKKEIQTLVEE